MLRIQKKYVVLALAVCFQLNGGMQAAAAEEGSKSVTAVAVAQSKQEAEKFDYQLDNQNNSPRDDPFYPFLSQGTTQPEDPDPIIVDDVNRGLCEMCKFEPGQLKLVAVMASSSGGRMAMAEDNAGTGYVLKEGMLIGKWGKVEHIEDEAVRIAESKKTKSGRELPANRIIMRLSKEAEK